jgi:uncharacterized Zn finger protein
VDALVARFDVRRRAVTGEFAAGVRLARQDAVALISEDGDKVVACVRDPDPLAVELRVEDGELAGSCTCAQAATRACRHLVAVEHLLWVRRRQHR